MKTLRVDLRTRRDPPRRAWWLLAVLALLAVGMAAMVIREARALEDLKVQQDSLLRELEKPIEAPKPVAQKMPYDASAREMLALATSEWPKMLTALEAVAIAGVTPVAIEIMPAERWVRVEVEFSDYAVLVEYIDALNAGQEKPLWGLVQAQLGSRTTGSQAADVSTASLRGSW